VHVSIELFISLTLNKLILNPHFFLPGRGLWVEALPFFTLLVWGAELNIKAELKIEAGVESQVC
jgi:hypothetical protein